MKISANLFAILVSFWCVAYARECIVLETRFIQFKCIPHVRTLNALMDAYNESNVDVEYKTKAANVCKDILECLAQKDCDEANEYQKKFTDACDGLKMLGAQMEKCLIGFQRSINEGKHECAKKYDFISINMTRRKESYTAGKECFMSIAKKECPQVSVDYLEQNYDSYVSLRTNRPEACEGNHHLLDYYDCAPFFTDLPDKLDFLKEHDFKVNNTKMLEAIETCDRAAKCHSCQWKEEQNGETEKMCKYLRIANTEAVNCIEKMDKMKVDEKKFPYAKEAEDKAVHCNRTSEVIAGKLAAMKEYCGQSAADDFVKNQDTYYKYTGCD